VRARLADDQPPDSSRRIVRFEVIDTGIGIAPEDTERLFEPFSQADASTTRRFGGTGLGLTISRRLAALMGGELGVDSQVGKGSRFWCSVPFGVRPAAARPRAASNGSLDGLRVLVVDDNDTNRLVLEHQLRAWRMNPTAVDTGPAALARLHTAAAAGQPYDLAILDLHMPVMDGVELARRITADPAVPTVHLVLLTSGAEANAGSGTGIAATLTKPVRQSQLFDVLAKAALPAGAADRADPAASGEPALRPASSPRSRGHLLLVEDNPINQTVALGILAKLGYSADVANNGYEALEMTARGSYAAVLMDCQMPQMDGFAATIELRRREGPGEHLPVIAMTAAAFTEDRERCIAAGMDDYVTKPISRDLLAAALTHWTAQPVTAAPATAAPADGADRPALRR